MEKSTVLLNNGPCVLPDGKGGYGLCPELLTEDEAIRFLRLDAQKADAKETLKYYREQKKLHATIIGRNTFYARTELQLFIERVTRS